MNSYPEKIPTSISPIKNFYFSLENSKQIKRDLENQIDTLDDRIDKIVDHFTLQDMPVIRFILNLSHDKDELKNIAKALDRVADLIEAKDSLTPKLEVLKAAETDPNWFAWAFGDFSSDVEFGLDNILYNINED